MKSYGSCAIALLALLLAGADSYVQDYGSQSLDVLRFMAERPWRSPYRWEKIPRIDADMGTHAQLNMEQGNDIDDEMRMNSEKRSAVASALNNGRRRRQPTPALGKDFTPYVGVGVLNDMSSYFNSLRNNVETLASLSPQERTTFIQPPSVVQAPSSGGGGGGGFSKITHLRPFRPSNNIRSYNRRSNMEMDGEYPGANHHDPELLWTGLGR